MDKPIVRVGIGVLILDKENVLLGRRIDGHNKNTWQSAGGHLEFGETFKECALREINEEVGIQVDNIQQVITTNDIFPKENKHYVTIFMSCQYTSGTPKLLEPKKCREWKWFSRRNLPDNLFLPYDKILSFVK
jgi:8-oxo-dGTP diphosphatase